MSFCDRFIKLPIEFVKKANENLGETQDASFKGTIKVLPYEIIGWRKRFDSEGFYNNETTVLFKHTDDMIIDMPVEEFEKALNEFHEKLYKND